ncbi:MAG: hypothetical protein MUD01_26495 [Chloroflexaceae bacterium]|jgi:hypothetical protein|nr:hypothetical protein [Chloroflexaceae bacterium]
MRTDLLALSPDDLVLLANRGLVKRAQQELQAGELQVELEEADDGTVTARWSDGVTCGLPGGKPASAGTCSCPATTICRHLLRTVLAYQAHVAAHASEAPPAPVHPWNPGSISDEQLAQHVTRPARTWARQAYDSGQVFELVCSAKPTAYCHSLACSVRFLVPGDVRYTHCDCAEPAPCRHVPLAVWAFRLLDEGRTSGIVETNPTPHPVPTSLLDDLDGTLRELVLAGMNGAPQPLIERLRRIESRLRSDGMVWPADAMADMLQQHAAYATHDARFTPVVLSRLMGELCVRGDAVRASTGAVPQLFVRGAANDRETSLARARLTGLGCSVRVRRGGVELAAYMQDADSGSLIVVRRDTNDPEDQTVAPPPFWQLAQWSVAKGVTLAALAGGQALVKGGKRLPNGTYLPSRAQLALNPQAYAWESLRAPLLAEDFSELAAHISAQPPPALRPRRLSDGLYVCAVKQIDRASFDPVEHAVRAILSDHAGGQALLTHPYTSRGQSGVEALLAALTTRPGDLRFVAGHVRLSPHGPVIAPTALVFQDGAMRVGLLPWLAREQPGAASITAADSDAAPARHDPLADYWAQIEEALGDLLVVGLQRADERQARRWRELHRQGAALGFGQLLPPLERLALALEEKAHTLRWDGAPTATTVLELVCLALLAGEAITTV